MNIKQKPMGDYQTNCYIVTVDEKDFIIDPGMGATQWVVDNVTNPVAILNTHGHFDHVWSNAELKEKLKLPIYTPSDDIFMLTAGVINMNVPPSEADVMVEGDKIVTIENIKITFHHMPGHTKGCSMIEIGDAIFSGDFIFRDSIGRTDFTYSDSNQMVESLKKLSRLNYDKTVYPGHGGTTTISHEQRNTKFWIAQLMS